MVMNSASGEEGGYEVELSGLLIREVRRLGELALQVGIEDAYIAAMKQIHHRLAKDPMVFGEERNRLAALRLVIRVAIVPPLVVRYGVHEGKPLVFLQSIEGLPRSGLSNE